MKTIDGKSIMPVFRLKDESGLPFYIIASLLKDVNSVPDWQDYFARAVKANWTPERIFVGVEELAGPLGFNTEEFKDKCKLMLMSEIQKYERL